MSRHPFLFPAILTAMAGIAMAAEHGDIYLPDGRDEAAARAAVQAAMPRQPEGWELACHVLPRRCSSLQDAEMHARAIEAGIHELPCLVLSDDSGPYAVLPLHDLQERDIAAARKLASSLERPELHKQRLFQAHIYLLCARTAYCDQADTGEMAAVVQECRQLMQDTRCTPERKQFLGFHCLYPMLMRQYAAGYKGAHTPATEAKLLEAIASLEAARDINPDSTVGRKAYAERERLRAARRKSRNYE